MERPAASNSVKALQEFHRPENYDRIDAAHRGKGVLWAGANDWEDGWTWAGLHDPSDTHGDNPLTFIQIDHKDCPGCHGDRARSRKDAKLCADYGREQVRQRFGVRYQKALDDDLLPQEELGSIVQRILKAPVLLNGVH